MAEEKKQKETKGSDVGQNTGPSAKMIVVVIVVLALAAAGYFALTGQEDYQPPSPTDAEQTQTVPAENDGESAAETQSGEAREISVEGDEYSFTPESITIKESEMVRVTFTNVGRFPHNFVIDELGVASETIPAGGSDTVEFTADQSGTFYFYCSVGNHRELGMEGELEVE